MEDKVGVPELLWLKEVRVGGKHYVLRHSSDLQIAVDTITIGGSRRMVGAIIFSVDAGGCNHVELYGWHRLKIDHDVVAELVRHARDLLDTNTDRAKADLRERIQDIETWQSVSDDLPKTFEYHGKHV